MSPHAPKVHNETPPSQNETQYNIRALPPPLDTDTPSLLQHIPHHCHSLPHDPMPSNTDKKCPQQQHSFGGASHAIKVTSQLALAPTTKP